MVFATKVMNLKTLLFSKYKYTILTPSTEILDGNSFSNYRMGKTLFIQNSFGNTCVEVNYRDVGVELKKWIIELFGKNAQCVFVLTSTSRYSVRPHSPHMGKGLVI